MVKDVFYLWLLLNIFLIARTEILYDEEVCEYPDEPSPEPCQVSNVALHKPAKQSSQRSDADASRAVDGNADQHFNRGSCTHTVEKIAEGIDPTPWLVVDLGKPHAVQYVLLISRDNLCCAERYHDIQIRVGNDLEYGMGNVFYRNGLCSEIVGAGYPQGHNFTFDCLENISGRYVSVQIVRECNNCTRQENPDLNRNVLSICELEVYGCPV